MTPSVDARIAIRNLIDEMSCDGEIDEEDIDGIGICYVCGAENYGLEPDAEAAECEHCGAEAVFGFMHFMLDC